MKKIALILAGLAFWAVSCIEDKGNYTYSYPEEPQVTIAESYEVALGDQLVVRPTVTFSDKSKLSYEWEISDPEKMTSYTYAGEELNIPFGLKARTYSAVLTVTEATTGMKYFYKFTVTGRTEFSEGTLVLASASGHSLLHFVKPDGTVVEDIYAKMNGGESLPDKPLQIVTRYNKNYMGNLFLGYWLFFGDTQHPGMMLDVNTLIQSKTFRENFYSPPTGDVSMGCIAPRDDNGTIVGIVGGKFYTGSFEGYYEMPGYSFFSVPTLGTYTLAPQMATADYGFFWCYDTNRKALVCLMSQSPGGVFYSNPLMAGPPAQWDPSNVGGDLVSLLVCNAGGYLFAKKDGVVRQYPFTPAGMFCMCMMPATPFAHASLLTDNTKWVISNGGSNIGVIYFSSGNKVYRYNPNSGQVEALVAQLQGEVTMLKFARTDARTENFGQLMVGTPGHLYRLSLTGTAGNDGQMLNDQAINGSPVDIYQRKDYVQP